VLPSVGLLLVVFRRRFSFFVGVVVSLADASKILAKGLSRWKNKRRRRAYCQPLIGSVSVRKPVETRRSRRQSSRGYEQKIEQ
jgi:hypothetical protein